MTERFTLTIVGSFSAPEWKTRTPRHSVIFPEDLPMMSACFPNYFDDIIVKVGDVSLPRGGREMINKMLKVKVKVGSTMTFGGIL